MEKEKQLAAYFRALALPYEQKVYVSREALGLTEQDVRDYQRKKEEEVSLKPQQKRDLVIREAVRPLLKVAGFKGSKPDWYKELEDCWLMIHLKNSRFNNASTGANFGFLISATKKGELRETVTKQWIYNQFLDINQSSFLPYCGYLSPYFAGSMYKIDGYRNYLPTDEPVEKITARIKADFQDYILPQLADVKTFADWEALRQKNLARYQEREVALLIYYHTACSLACSESNRPHLLGLQSQCGLTQEEITAHFDWLEIIEQYSAQPNIGAKPYILKTLGLL